MREDFDSILDKCLSQIRTGEVDIESCLSQYPEHAARLRPLLETASLLWQEPQPQPRPKAVSQGEQLVLERVVEKRSSKAMRKGFAKAIGDKIGIGGQVPKRSPSPPPRWRLRWVGVVVGILVLFALGGGVVAASSNSMPGELLYPVKIATEQARLVLTPSEAGKAELHIALAGHRMEEIAEMSERGQAEQVVKLVPMVVQHLEEAKQIIVATGEGKVAQELKTKLEDSAVQQLAVLDGALQQATEDTKPVVAQALETSGESYGTAIEAAIISAPAPPLVGKVGTIQIFVTDPPLPDVAHVWVWVENIEVHLAAGPDSRWIPVADKAGPFDLMALEGVQEFIASKEIGAGFYTQLRMNVTEAIIEEIVKVGDEDVLVPHEDVFVPSGRLKFVRPFEVKDGEITDLVLDFDGDRSLNVTGAGQYMLKPVVSLLVPETGREGGPAGDGGEAGGILSIDVSKWAEATETGAEGEITITNSSEVPVTVESVTDTVYWQPGSGEWRVLAHEDVEFTLKPDIEIPAGETWTFAYTMTFALPPEARELRNVIEVEVVGRAKVFHDIVGFAPYGYVELEQVEFVGTLSEEEGQWFITMDVNKYILDLSEVEEVEGTLEEAARAKVKGVLEEDTILATEVEVMKAEASPEAEERSFVGTLSEEEGQWFITVDVNKYILDLSEVEEVEGTLEEAARAKVKGVLEEDTILAIEVEIKGAKGGGI